MPQGHTPFTVIHFWGALWGALFSACWKREMLHVACEEVEIYFAKIGFMDSKCSNLNTPGSYALCCHSLLGCILGCHFKCITASVTNSVEIIFHKIGLMGFKLSKLTTLGFFPLVLILLLTFGIPGGVLFSASFLNRIAARVVRGCVAPSASSLAILMTFETRNTLSEKDRS